MTFPSQTLLLVHADLTDYACSAKLEGGKERNDGKAALMCLVRKALRRLSLTGQTSRENPLIQRTTPPSSLPGIKRAITPNWRWRHHLRRILKSFQGMCLILNTSQKPVGETSNLIPTSTKQLFERTRCTLENTRPIRYGALRGHGKTHRDRQKTPRARNRMKNTLPLLSSIPRVTAHQQQPLFGIGMRTSLSVHGSRCHRTEQD